ncbi:albusnodin/ikarugamycin family macrolactam cyclase [Nocardiopsis lambiniae]|uniref:asparagine synthase (glutamine-hydrolyzing) n=1 Tax=Nocardiopsis lambiniae TaxID=3075539 RepID=A0ABU2M9A3_9ACTN|nr:albusnodin/ikarugamycin family macrolactam cyclase [Nocardiopsis sp. DSM 44743]MDT0329197.1 albusnodin/ikarugamycin family macrolactam cyclase [Nocardiopsis sp. DSM 44743]
MGWFGGVVTAAVSSAPRPMAPTWSEVIPCGELWRVGPGAGPTVTVTRSGPLMGAVLGSHTVSADDLRGWLRGAWRTGPSSWAGMYAVVVAHRGGATVFADPVHALPLYFCEVEGSVVWASSSRALAGLTDTGVDLAWLSGLLMDPAGPHFAERSAFQQVHAVPPGHSLDMRYGGRTVVDRWWSPPRTRPRAETVPRFGRALEGAVEVRFAQAERLSCDLSGGLDSTSLCLLAEQRATGSRRLTAWTVHPASRDHGGDLDHAREAARGRLGMRHELLALGETELPYSGLEQIPPTDEPAPSTVTCARHILAYERIRTAGNTLHMTGDGGDALLMQSPELALRPAVRGRVIRTLRDLHGWAKLDRRSPAGLLRQSARGGNRFSCRWLTPKAQAMTALGGGRGVLDLLRSDAELLTLRGIGRTAHADAQFAEAFGVRLEAPFLDRSVVEAALAFRVTDRGSPWSYKPQLAEAMRDVLPEAITRRRTKGGTDADHHLGLRAHLPEVSVLLDGWLAGHGLIDPQELRRELHMAALGRDSPWGLLEPVISAEVWGRAVEASPPAAWTRSRARKEA